MMIARRKRFYPAKSNGVFWAPVNTALAVLAFIGKLRLPIAYNNRGNRADFFANTAAVTIGAEAVALVKDLYPQREKQRNKS